MNAAPASATTLNAPAVRPRRRWLRGVLLTIGLTILAATLFLGYSYVTMNAAWDQAEAEAALDLPRWRLLEMEADRPAIPDKENSTLHMIAVRAKAAGFSGVSAAPRYELIFE